LKDDDADIDRYRDGSDEYEPAQKEPDYAPHHESPSSVMGSPASCHPL
jgi:hypothetical protein